MIDVELNKRINALWAQFPADDIDSLQEKFYAYILTGKTEKLRQLISEHPLMKEIAAADPTIFFGSVYSYYPDMLEYMAKELGLGVEQPREEAMNRTLLLEVLYHHHTEHRNVNLSVAEKFELKRQTIEKLLSLGADVLAADLVRNSSLHYAINRLTVQDLLVDNNASIIIDMLLKAGANPNQQNYHGFTALHAVLTHDKRISLFDLEPMIKLLLKYGADENIHDIYGATPRMLVLSRPPLNLNRPNTSFPM